VQLKADIQMVDKLIKLIAANMQIQTDFFKQSSPGEASRYIVSKYTKQLVQAILQDVEDFSLKINLKEKSLNQLYNLLICVEGAIKPHCEKILKQIVYKFILDEEPGIATRVLKITELLGLYVPTDYLLPMVISHLTDNDSKSVPLFVSSSLTALSAIITHSSVRFGDQFEHHIDKLVALILSSDYL